MTRLYDTIVGAALGMSDDNKFLIVYKNPDLNETKVANLK
jgi:hypothetical protein